MNSPVINNVVLDVVVAQRDKEPFVVSVSRGFVVEVQPTDVPARNIEISNFQYDVIVTQAGRSPFVVKTARNYVIEVQPIGPPGEDGEDGSGPILWSDIAVSGSTDGNPTPVTNGSRFTYTFSSETYYRFVPAPYLAANDAFYSDISLTNMVAARG